MASRLATAIYVAMVTQFYMTILIVQMTQISNMKVISLMIDFFQTLALLSSVVSGNFLPLTIELIRKQGIIDACHYIRSRQESTEYIIW